MNTLNKKIIGASLGVFLFGSSIGQNCNEEYTYCDRGKDKNFQMSNQSVSGTFAAGETHEVSLILYKGTDYRLSFCSNDEAMDGKIEYEIITRKKKRVLDPTTKRYVFKEQEESLFKNTNSELAQTVEFQSKDTKKVYIKVTLPSGASEGKNKNSLKASDAVCVGMLVQHQKGTTTGFNR
jgi:hypothetical protein